MLIFCIQIKRNTIKDPTLPFEFDPDTPFTMVLMEVDKSGKLRPRQVGKGIATMLLDKFFDYLGCIKEDAVWWSFNMKDLVHEGTGGLRIWTEKEYVVLTGIMSKPDAKRTAYLRLANSKEVNEGEEEDISA